MIHRQDALLNSDNCLRPGVIVEKCDPPGMCGLLIERLYLADNQIFWEVLRDTDGELDIWRQGNFKSCLEGMSSHG